VRKLIALNEIRHSLDGEVIYTLATCDRHGIPNIVYLSDAYYVDNQHIALSYQFFNKTRRNILANPRATLLVTDPRTLINYQLTLLYLRTEESGAVFEIMKARLASIAEWTGMQAIFHLKGADIYKVLYITQLPGPRLPPALPGATDTLPSPYTALRDAMAGLSQCGDLESVINSAISSVQILSECSHGMLLIPDETAQQLFVIASFGYHSSGVGSELQLNSGLIGVCAKHRCLLKINHRASDYVYSQALNRHHTDKARVNANNTAIPFPALDNTSSQLAIPLLHQEQITGVIYLESECQNHFRIEHEDRLKIFSEMLTLKLQQLTTTFDDKSPVEACTDFNPDNIVLKPVHTANRPIDIRYYLTNQSIFINGEYLIKGIAGAILWSMLEDYTNGEKTLFSNRELRLDSRIGLPELSNNLEARLLLLQRRLNERTTDISLAKAGRGKIRLVLSGPLSTSVINE
jgi:adenylate cyclase